MKSLTVAVSKGKLLPDTVALFESAGYTVPDLHNGRRLIADDEQGALRFLLAKPDDVPTYVEHGAADLGVAGLDVVMETNADVYQPLRLGVAQCRLSVAAPKDLGDVPLRLRPDVRVATKYPRLARDYFLGRGLSVEIITLRGSIELAPVVGLADLIVDIVETGRTLRANGLEELRVIMESEAVLIINRATHKLRLSEVNQVVDRLQEAIAARRDEQERAA
ncbi:MAG: ATP phosphoribosyltransferase [Anaerolineales bacterium]|nr:ATP phosphoribosyltransferase [Anaerolineales bacterium]